MTAGALCVGLARFVRHFTSSRWRFHSFGDIIARTYSTLHRLPTRISSMPSEHRTFGDAIILSGGYSRWRHRGGLRWQMTHASNILDMFESSLSHLQRASHRRCRDIVRVLDANRRTTSHNPVSQQSKFLAECRPMTCHVHERHPGPARSRSPPLALWRMAPGAMQSKSAGSVWSMNSWSNSSPSAVRPPQRR